MKTNKLLIPDDEANKKKKSKINVTVAQEKMMKTMTITMILICQYQTNSV